MSDTARSAPTLAQFLLFSRRGVGKEKSALPASIVSLTRVVRDMRYAKNTQDQGGSMPIVTAVVLSMFLLTVTGCATSSDPSATKQETDQKDPVKKGIKYDQKKEMNIESQNAVR
jgi:hypothetical protein